MANDLIIGGSTYKNIDYIRVMRSDGTVATYYDKDRIDHRVMKASIEKVVDGAAYAVAATGLESDAPSGTQVNAIPGASHETGASLNLDDPQATMTQEE